MLKKRAIVVGAISIVFIDKIAKGGTTVSTYEENGVPIENFFLILCDYYDFSK